MTEETTTSRTSVKPSKVEDSKFPVRLLKNYVPTGEYVVVGYHKPALVQKAASGQMVVVEPAAFMHGAVKEPPYPGAGSAGKIWADTVIRLPLEEAKRVIGMKIAERADELPG